jgi:hypothetical protein
MTIENCLTLSITDLNKNGFFRNRKTVEVINLTKNNGQCLSVDLVIVFDENEKYLTLSHTIETTINKTETYRINIVSIASNIGNGSVLYFVCPLTAKCCRKLYYHRGKFMHREATGILYEQQKRKQFISHAFYLSKDQRNEPNTKYFKKYYKGNFTKRYLQILLRTSHSEVVDVYRELSGKLKL